MKVPKENYTFRQLVEVPCDLDNTSYETPVFPDSDARQQQESAGIAGSTDLEQGFY